MVIRLLSRNWSTALSDTQILFTGRCERPLSGDKESLTITAKFILGSTDVTVPRRTYGPEDFKGRAATDPEFEGFTKKPSFGSFQYPREEHSGGFLGWWNRRQVIATMQWSSYSDLTDKKAVAETHGRVQLQGVLVAAADVGTQIRCRWAFGEGPVQDITNTRSTNPELPLNMSSYAEQYGLVGAANGDDPTWPGGPGYYSRTVMVRGQADNSLIDVDEAAPDVVAVIEAKICTTPDANGTWNTEAWTDNAAAVVRYYLRDENYFNLDANWIDDATFTEVHRYNAEEIFNTTVSDYVYVEEET
jgi:hypothetical protein